MFRCLAYCTVHSGVETGGSGGTMNRGPKLLGGPSPWPKNFTAEKVIYLAENTKNIKTLGVGGLHRFPDPVAGPRAPKPHLRSQHFGLPVEGIEGPQVTVNQSPSEPCYATDTKLDTDCEWSDCDHRRHHGSKLKVTTCRVSFDSHLPFLFLLLFSARFYIYISRLCYDVCVRLSVTEVHWIAVYAGNTAAAPAS